MKNLFFSFILIVGALSTMNAQNPTPPAGLRVEILVFSGRPNPVFTITDPIQIDGVIAAAEALPSSEAASSAAAERPVLGYRGIKVTNLSVDRSSVQAMQVNRTGVRIHRKSIASAKNTAAASSSAPEARSDATGALEAQLLTLARDHGVVDDRLLAHIKQTK
jgi:hypothetical protein